VGGSQRVTAEGWGSRTDFLGGAPKTEEGGTGKNALIRKKKGAGGGGAFPRQ